MPKKKIPDNGFVYRNAAETDLKLTFERVRRRLREEAEEKKKAEAAIEAEQAEKVRTLKKD